MTPDLHLPEPPIAGPGFALRPWHRADASDVAAACNDPVTQRFIVAMPRPYTLEHAKGFIARAAENLKDGHAIGVAISRPSGQAIGSVTLHTGEPQHWHIGYWMAPAWRSKGITTAAVRVFARWAFADYPELVRLSLFTLPDHSASQRVAERAGFTQEGTLRAWDRSAGTPRDVVMFSLLRTDLGAGSQWLSRSGWSCSAKSPRSRSRSTQTGTLPRASGMVWTATNVDSLTITFSSLQAGMRYTVVASKAHRGSPHTAPTDEIMSWYWGVQPSGTMYKSKQVTHDPEFVNWPSVRLFTGGRQAACGDAHQTSAAQH